MSRFAPILSPQAPADLKPVPYAERKVARALPLTAPQRQALSEMGVITLGDLDLWLARGNTFVDVKGVGPKSAEKIQLAYDSMQR